MNSKEEKSYTFETFVPMTSKNSASDLIQNSEYIMHTQNWTVLHHFKSLITFTNVSGQKDLQYVLTNFEIRVL